MNKQDIVYELLSSDYYFFSTGDEKGYWIKSVDSINSLFIKDIIFDFRRHIRERLQDANKSNSSGQVDEILKILREQKYLTRNDFRVDGRLIHFKNGIYFIESGIFYPRKYSVDNDLKLIDNLKYQVHTFKVIPFDYKPNPSFENKMTWDNWGSGWEIQEFKQYLETVFYISPEMSGKYRVTTEEQIKRWWEWMGYCLTDVNDIKAAALYRGVRHTGKSTLSKIQIYTLTRDILGDGENDLVSYESFHNICHDKESKAAMHGKKLNYDDDVGASLIKFFEKFKQITGMDRHRMRPLYENPFSGLLTVKFQMCANELPPVKGIDENFTCRWIIFFFNHVFYKPDWDRAFLYRMKSPKVAQYIIHESIKGLNRLLKRGYFEGMGEQEILHYWLLETDAVYKFINLCCKTKVNWKDSAVQNILYEQFNEFVDNTGTKTWIKAQRQFTEQMTLRGYPVRDGGKRTIWNDEKAVNETKHVKIYHGIRLDQDKYDKLFGIKDKEYRAKVRGHKDLLTTADEIKLKERLAHEEGVKNNMMDYLIEHESCTIQELKDGIDSTWDVTNRVINIMKKENIITVEDRGGIAQDVVSLKYKN